MQNKMKEETMKIYTCTITHMWNNEMEPMTASFSTRKKAEMFAQKIREINSDYVATIDSGIMDSDMYINILTEEE